MTNHTQLTLPEINKVVSPLFCKKAALQVGFTKRSTSRLNGFEFVITMILGTGNDSLLTFSHRMKKFNPKVTLSLPGLAQRINRECSEKLMLRAFIQCLTNTYERGITKLKGIGRILIQDSTCLGLNKKLAHIYAGTGGHSKTSALKIDCIYDYTNENILNVNSCSRTVTDSANGREIFKHLLPSDLVLRDLGYFKIEELNKITELFAFYVSRIKIDIKVYLKTSDEEPIEFIQFLRKKLKKNHFLDCEVYIGHRKEKVRLIVNKLPEEIVNEKIRKARRGSQVAGRKLSDSKKAFLSYTILITNLPQTQIPAKEIILLYRVRWRVELLFKEWKSQLNIENILGTNIHRIRCLIYGRLCFLLIMNKLTSYLSKLSLELYGRELSFKKALDLLLIDGAMVDFFLSKSPNKYLENVKNDYLHLLLKNKYKKRKTTREMIMSSNMVLL